MTMESDSKRFQFEISLSVLNHLGRNLYRNFITVVGEAISNSWDADARNVWIDIDKEKGVFTIKDDGVGMTADGFQNKFLRIGYSKRKDGKTTSGSGRPFIGAKGIGKLALLSCAQRVSVFTKTSETDYVGGVIDNSGLDDAIKRDLVPDQYPLEALNFKLIDGISKGHDRGTILVFEGTSELLRNSKPYIKKLLAMSFRFSLLDPDFTIHVNDEPVTLDDLQELLSKTEFVWVINEHKDEFIDRMTELKSSPIALSTDLEINGFIATVERPRDLKITGTDDRATIDLFVNGRLREKNIIRHIPTQRIVESYIYGQIHFDLMDQTGDDPFTSSREGIVEDDSNFQNLLEYMKNKLLVKIVDQWDKLRLDRNEDGDEENPRLNKKSRKARSLYVESQKEFQLKEGESEKDKVDGWIKELTPDAEFNISAYVDCFLSENLVRKYIHSQGIALKSGMEKKVKEWREIEKKRKQEANISFQIRKDDDDLSYLDMDALAVCAEGSKANSGKQSLWLDAIKYKPARNAVGHTGLLTPLAKTHLNLTFENMKARVKALLNSGES